MPRPLNRVPADLPNAVRKWCTDNGVSLRELSARVGCARGYLYVAFSRLEHGTRRGMSREVLKRLERVTGLSVDTVREGGAK